MSSINKIKLPNGTTYDVNDVRIPGVDTAPTSGSSNVVTSGGVYTGLSGKADKSATVSTVTYDTTNKKITKTINGTTTDVVTASTLVTDGGGIKNVKTVNNNSLVGTGNVSVGTVTSVSAGTGLSIGGTATVNPTVNIASGYKLPTTTEWNAKAPLASPALTGTPTAPTAAAGTNTVQIATTAFVKNAVDSASTSSENLKTEQKTNQEIVFRKTNVDWEAKAAKLTKILGRTEAWNQLVGPSDTQVTIPSGHLYYAIINGTASAGTSDGTPISVTGGVDIVVDLTLEGLGLTTADQFRALHPLPYYNYNAGVLKNNAATWLETTGFNQWDEEWENGVYSLSTGKKQGNSAYIRSKNLIRILPDTVYYKCAGTGATDFSLVFFDANKNFVRGMQPSVNTEFTTPSGCYYMGFYINPGSPAVYNHDICINRSDASRNGTYEPYWKREIVLGLNSLACHDENNNAVVVNGLDGVGTSQDELIVENGWGTKIIKRRGRRAYQAGDESDATLMTDGTNTDYPLTTPKVLTPDNPIPALIEVDNLGTEKRLPEDTADNPQAPFECDIQYGINSADIVNSISYLDKEYDFWALNGSVPAGRYSCVKCSGSGITSAVCCNGNIIINGSAGTYVMTLANFYESFMKSIGGYSLTKASQSDADKIDELAFLMSNSYIIKEPAGTGSSFTRYSNSHQLAAYGSGTKIISFTFGESTNGTRLLVDSNGVTITLV